MRPLLLVILLLSLLVPVRAEEILVLSVSTDQNTYEAGDRGVMNLTFTNNSDQLVEDIDVEVRSSNILFFTKTANIESILYGSETVELKFQCKNLEDGVYPVYITYYYIATSKSCQGGICQKIQDKKTYELTIKNEEPRISLETNTLKVADNKASITFRNVSETAIDFQFEIISDLQVQHESYIGYLLSSSSKELVIYGEPGEYQGTVHVTYRDRFNRNYEKTFPVKIVIEEKEEVKQVSLQPKTTEYVLPTIAEDQIRKIEINVASAEGTPASQYYVYIMVLSCISLMGAAMFVKLKNFRK